MYRSLFCLQVLRIQVATSENYIFKERFLLLKANVTEKSFSYFHIQHWLVSLLIVLSEWNMSSYSFFLYWLPQSALYFTGTVKIKLNCFLTISDILEKYFILSSRVLVARYNALYHRKTTVATYVSENICESFFLKKLHGSRLQLRSFLEEPVKLNPWLADLKLFMIFRLYCSWFVLIFSKLQGAK